MRLLCLLAVAAALVAVPLGPAFAGETTIVTGAPAANDPAILDAARAKVAGGDTKGAIAGLAPYVADHPRDAAAGRLLGDLYFRVPDFAKAERVWKALLAIDSNDRETHSRLGALYAAHWPSGPEGLTLLSKSLEVSNRRAQELIIATVRHT